MNIIFIPINQLFGKIVCKFQYHSNLIINDNDGQYPKIGWIHQSNTRVGREHVKYRVIRIEDSPQSHFMRGDKQYYKDYMSVKGWVSGYGRERVNAVQNFESLSKNFKQYLGKGFKHRFIECVKENGKYIIVDGLHRASIIYSKLGNKESDIRIKVIKCPDFVNLPT